MIESVPSCFRINLITAPQLLSRESSGFWDIDVTWRCRCLEHLMVSLSQPKEHSLLVEATFRHRIEGSPCWPSRSREIPRGCPVPAFSYTLLSWAMVAPSPWRVGNEVFFSGTLPSTYLHDFTFPNNSLYLK